MQSPGVLGNVPRYSENSNSKEGSSMYRISKK
jgi:hypothetical protein